MHSITVVSMNCAFQKLPHTKVPLQQMLSKSLYKHDILATNSTSSMIDLHAIFVGGDFRGSWCSHLLDLELNSVLKLLLFCKDSLLSCLWCSVFFLEYRHNSVFLCKVLCSDRTVDEVLELSSGLSSVLPKFSGQHLILLHTFRIYN